MAIPPFHQHLLPALISLGDGKVWTNQKLSDALAKHFGLTEADCKEMLPSGARTRYRDRAIWSLVYLYHAGLVARPKRGQYEITPVGRALLKDPPKEIDQNYLIANYPSFAKFAKPTEKSPSGEMPSAAAEVGVGEATPTERLESAFQELQTALCGEIIDRLAQLTPQGFERAVLQLLRAMGYAADEESVVHTGKSGDEGIDGIIYQDPLGLDRVYVQAKNWASSVSGPELSQFVGAMDLQGASKGVFVTRSSFTAQANSFASKSMKRIVLVDGARMARLMIQYEVGVATARSYKLARIDTDFFDEDAE